MKITLEHGSLRGHKTATTCTEESESLRAEKVEFSLKSIKASTASGSRYLQDYQSPKEQLKEGRIDVVFKI